MKNHKRISVPRLLTPVALAITLAACSSKPAAPTYVDITLDPVKSAQSYLMQADSSKGSLQTDWLIMALKATVDNQDFELAQRLTQRIAKQPLSEIQQAEWQLARAELLQLDGQYDQALGQLNFQPQWTLPNEQWKDYHQLRADLYTQLHRYFSANRELVALSQYQSQELQDDTAALIWDNFSLYNESEITALNTAPEEDILDGWLQLAVYMKTLASNVPQLKNALENWLAENPDHPAAQHTPQSIQDILALEITKPTNTALLLPLSGKFAKQAQLIRDGFIMAMMNDDEKDSEATLTILDTNQLTPDQLKLTLLEKNIDFVVGPLTKANVEMLEEVQDDLSQPIPTLALNIPESVEEGTNTCYLALSPEQEVAQAAKHLAEQGFEYPLILAPQGRLGERVVESFDKEWKKHSDNKVAVNLFGDKRQLQRNINSVFGLQESQQRIAQMDSLMDMSLESMPRSRRDIDSVYIVAKSSDLTLIKPFIEVAINPDTQPPKLFSNSRSNSSATQYEDLTGVEYSDIPLLIQPDTALKAQMDALWPKGSNAEKRLQALGMDAYQLMEELPQMKVVADYTVQGQTGVLSIDEQCVVQREISWAKREAI
ncbi:penicillin-binding protein activator [Vibrio paucivorans]